MTTKLGNFLNFMVALYCAGSIFIWTPGASAQDILVFAAASSAEAFNRVIKENPNKTYAIKVSYASSGALARQIENGAPASLFLSANELWTKRLAQKNLLSKRGSVNLLYNRLVLAAPITSKLDIKITKGFDLLNQLGNGLLAIGDPSHVPAGIYAKTALKNLRVWKLLTSRTARTPDARNTLALIERAAVPAGIIYRSDLIASARIRIVDTFPENVHPPIVYPLSIIKEYDTAEARRLFEFLQSNRAIAIFKKHGFGTE